MKKLPTPQLRVLRQYIDCKRQTKKSVLFAKNTAYNGGFTDDELLIRFMLENSSIVQDKGERSFREVERAVDVACKQLCPGQWCTRTHCENFSTWCAYNCTKTRPAVCNVYKKYIDGVNQRKQNTDNQ